MTWAFIARHSVRFIDAYHFEIDEYRRGDDQFLLVHALINNWTPSVLKQIRREWEIFRRVMPATLFATGQVDDKKWRKFVSMFGFQYLTTVLTECGEPRSLYVNYGQLKPTNSIYDANLPVGTAATLLDARLPSSRQRVQHGNGKSDQRSILRTHAIHGWYDASAITGVPGRSQLRAEPEHSADGEQSRSKLRSGRSE